MTRDSKTEESDELTAELEKLTADIKQTVAKKNEDYTDSMVQDSVAKEVTVFVKKVQERVDAKNSFDGYVHSLRVVEGSGDNKGISGKLDSDEKQVELDKVNSRLEKAERSLLSAGLTAPVAASSRLSRWRNQTSRPTWSGWRLRKRTQQRSQEDHPGEQGHEDVEGAERVEAHEERPA